MSERRGREKTGKKKTRRERAGYKTSERVPLRELLAVDNDYFVSVFIGVQDWCWRSFEERFVDADRGPWGELWLVIGSTFSNLLHAVPQCETRLALTQCCYERVVIKHKY